MTDPRKPAFEGARAAEGPLDERDVRMLHAALDALPWPRAEDGPARQLGPAGQALIKQFEGCAKARGDGTFEAYPDPGSRDGTPWTIGWGSTGRDIRPGTVWTQAQCDQRFAAEVQRYVREVDAAIGDAPTSQAQFDALVSFHYNTGAIGRATLTKAHRAGDYAKALGEFSKWVFNDGRKLKGLGRRRTAEADLYGSERP